MVISLFCSLSTEKGMIVIMNKISKLINPIQITQGPKHHFFGYYDKQQWDVSNRYILSNQVDF